MMRIGVITTSYPRFKDDYSGHFVAELNDAIVKLGHQIDVIAPVGAYSDNDKIRIIPCGKRNSKLSYGAGGPDNLLSAPFKERLIAWGEIPSFVAQMMRDVYRYQSKWDLIISHWILPSAFIADLVSHKKHIAIAHSSDVHLLHRLPFSSILVRRLSRQQPSLVLTSEELRVKLLDSTHRFDSRSQLWIDRAKIIRMGIHRLKPKENLGAIHRPMKIISVGRLVEVKGFHILIDALAGLDISLDLVGDGPERDRLKRLADEKGVDLRLHGTLLGEEKWNLMRAADLFVLPSIVLKDGRSDAAPVSLLEAMAIGLPTIATRSASSELLAGFGGLKIVEPENPHDLKRVILEFRDDSQKAKEYALQGMALSEHFTWDKIASKIMRL